MRKHLILISFLILPIVSLFAAQDAGKAVSGGGIDWFQLIFEIGYIGGVFILLPLVVYTNIKEKIVVPNSDSNTENTSLQELTEAERNNRAAKILESIEKKLTPFQSEDGADLLTITNGKQAKFVKHCLDYINKKLVPTDTDIIERVKEFTAVYNDRTKRVFAGSKWIIICAAGIGLFLFYQMGLRTFIVIHFLGLAFYILSSRVSMYTLEKRLKRLGKFGGGMIGSIFNGLFAGANAKHYVTYSSGKKERDYSSEFTGGAVYLLLMVVVAMFLGFLAAFLGVVNFIFNYSTSFIVPFAKDDSWYQKNFEAAPVQ